MSLHAWFNEILILFQLEAKVVAPIFFKMQTQNKKIKLKI
jgi:hypothetical protein